MKQPLKDEVEAFLQEAGMGDWQFGWLAAKNGRLVQRLRDGRRVWPDTEAVIREFIRAERRKMRRRTKRSAA